MTRLLWAFACLAIASAAVSGCGGSNRGARSEPESASPTPTLSLDRGAVSFNAADTRRLRGIFAADLSYLGRHGLAGASKVDLRLLSGSESFYCAPVELTYTARGPGPDYCQPTSGAPVGTVVLDARFLSDDVPALVTSGGRHLSARQLHATELGAAAAVLGHELGHAEQALRRGHRAPLAGVGVELQADCYSGQLVARAEPRLLGPALRFMRRVPGDARHGTAGQRLSAFDRGARGGVCASKE